MRLIVLFCIAMFGVSALANHEAAAYRLLMEQQNSLQVVGADRLGFRPLVRLSMVLGAIEKSEGQSIAEMKDKRLSRCIGISRNNLTENCTLALVASSGARYSINYTLELDGDGGGEVSQRVQLSFTRPPR